MAGPKLRPVPTAPVNEPPPDLSYEHQERQRIAARDWAGLHIRSDRSPPIDLPGLYRKVRSWRA